MEYVFKEVKKSRESCQEKMEQAHLRSQRALEMVEAEGVGTIAVAKVEPVRKQVVKRALASGSFYFLIYPALSQV